MVPALSSGGNIGDLLEGGSLSVRASDPSGRHCDQPLQLDEIVGCHRQRELEVELFDATQHRPSQSADSLAPTERLLDPLALLLTDLVSAMAGGATVDSGAAIGRVLSHVRRHV